MIEFVAVVVLVGVAWMMVFLQCTRTSPEVVELFLLGVGCCAVVVVSFIDRNHWFQAHASGLLSV
jgi:hypothetical protein